MRKPLISRTMTISEVTAEVVDLITEDMFEIRDILPRTFNNEREAEKAIQARLPEGQKVVRIVKVDVIQALYAMSEQVFLDHAHRIEGYKVSQTGEVFGPPG